ncbi:MAG: hypothetical protein J5965_00170 [Aeriscardovia sp.]|nr:hypothetical protein [Aeriscardovia sp.]
MKKWKFIICCCVIQAIHLYASDNITVVRERIAQLDSIYPTLTSKQHPLDTLLTLIGNYRELDTLLTNSIAEKDSLLNEYSPYTNILFLLSNDTMVFRNDYSDDIQVPQSLEYHFQSIKMITLARKRIETIENKIVNITENYAQEMLKSGQVIDIKSKISSEIEGDMDVVTELLEQIRSRELSSLSKEQYQYFKPGLTERYNNFIKFFE